MDKYQFNGHLTPRPQGTEQAMCALSGEVYLAAEVDAALARLNRIVSYLCDCHAASAEIIADRKSSSKSDRNRAKEICDSAWRYLQGDDPGFKSRSTTPVIERLQRVRLQLGKTEGQKNG